VGQCPVKNKICGVTQSAPEDSDNPLGYKFSWSSGSVLLALRNPAKSRKDGKVVDVESKGLIATAKPDFIYLGYAFVTYPNRETQLHTGKGTISQNPRPSFEAL